MLYDPPCELRIPRCDPELVPSIRTHDLNTLVIQPQLNKHKQKEKVNEARDLTNLTKKSVCLSKFSGKTIYRSGTVNSKSFVGKVLLRIKWKFELN